MGSNITQPLIINFPGKLVFGNGSLAALPQEIVNAGHKHAFIVTIEPLLAVLNDFLNELRNGGVAVTINTGIVQEPGFNDFETLLKDARAFNPDIVIGIGGG